MDLADIRSLVLKTQATILENVFPGFIESKHVSVAILLLAPNPCSVFFGRIASGVLVELHERFASPSLGLLRSPLQKWGN